MGQQHETAEWLYLAAIIALFVLFLTLVAVLLRWGGKVAFPDAVGVARQAGSAVFTA